MPTEIIFVSMLRALVEVAGLMLLLRGAMWLFGPKARAGNFVYDILTVGSMPFIRFTRAVMPRAVSDRYVASIAFLLLLALWVGLGAGQLALCDARGVRCV
jgi:hypothetical protein